MPSVPSDPSSQESIIRALREELQALRDASAAAGALARDAARYHLRQVRFRTVFEHSPLGHKIIGPDLLIRDANPAVVALLGLPGPEALLGRPILDFAHPAHRADWRALQRALWDRSLPAFALETRLCRPDGTELWCRVTSVLFPDEGGTLGYTTLEDISPRKHLEEGLAETARQRAAANEHLTALNEELTSLNEQLRVANEELQDANATLVQVNGELDTFVYAASHDLRTPLANLQGLVQALAEHGPAAAEDEHVPVLVGMMQLSVERLRAALDRLADFGTARHDMAGAREQLSVAAALEAVRPEVAPLLAAAGGRLEVNIAGTPYVWFSPKHLHSVLLNLISNAVKYRHPDRAPVVRVRAHREATRVVVHVKDNGRGLTVAQQAKGFRLFQRFHPDVEGTGVGLYLVKKIVDHAGGELQVQSEPGRGTTFTLVFPA
ncbi:MAG TPA: PAS domain-containing sensor histidine kinase [Hymenobacter sp.]|jgi:PAS domain S-box-containing protein|uniref:sensor histidine kinase n=1 Tax=Hymenobacter sp. TaxID=1898978 RepID=UPI002EDACD7B